MVQGFEVHRLWISVFLLFRVTVSVVLISEGMTEHIPAFAKSAKYFLELLHSYSCCMRRSQWVTGNDLVDSLQFLCSYLHDFFLDLVKHSNGIQCGLCKSE